MRRLDLRKTQAARLNTIRDINRQIVLNYVREREPISRAEIARETDLQRSTISAIVEALTAEGLVEEVGEGESTGGRRPTLLRLRTKEAIAIGEGEHRSFYEIIEASSQLGWMTFDQSILAAYENDLITEETARLFATRRRERHELHQPPAYVRAR